MALYGNDIDETTTLLEADLGWIAKLDKGDFTGRDALLRQRDEGLTRKLVGFETEGRAVARHGYRFVYPDVVEEPDEGPVPEPSSSAGPVEGSGPAGDAQADPFEPLIDRIVGSGRDRESEEQRRDAAQRLHVLGTAEALRRLGARPGHERARALLRDTRWDVATAGEVKARWGMVSE